MVCFLDFSMIAQIIFSFVSSLRESLAICASTHCTCSLPVSSTRPASGRKSSAVKFSFVLSLSSPTEFKNAVHLGSYEMPMSGTPMMAA